MSKRRGSQSPKGGKAPATKAAAAKVSPKAAAAAKAAAKEREGKKALAELARWEKAQKAKRSAAAQKGAATRKANAAAAAAKKEKRSAAAKRGAATKATKRAGSAAAPAPAPAPKAAKAPPGKIIHAGIKYRRKTHRDTKGMDNLRLEIAIELKAETPSPEELNAGMQTYALSQGEVLPSWAKRIDVVEWVHGKGRPQFAEDKEDIGEALADFANVIAESEFQYMGGG